MLIEAGLTDPRVTYWEPAKWAQLLRARMTGGGPILLKTNMEAGHGGAAGRFDELEEVALRQAFAVAAVGGDVQRLSPGVLFDETLQFLHRGEAIDAMRGFGVDRAVGIHGVTGAIGVILAEDRRSCGRFRRLLVAGFGQNSGTGSDAGSGTGSDAGSCAATGSAVSGASAPISSGSCSATGASAAISQS